MMIMMIIRLTLSQHLVYPDANAFVLQLSVPFLLSSMIMLVWKIISEYPCRICVCMWHMFKMVAFESDKYLHKIAEQAEIEKITILRRKCCFRHFYSLNLITRDTNKDVAGKYGYSNQLHNIINERHARDHP